MIVNGLHFVRIKPSIQKESFKSNKAMLKAYEMELKA